MRKCFRTIGVLFLSVLCIIGTINQSVFQVQAADPGKAFQLYIISETSESVYAGDFLLLNDNLYVEYDTLESFGDIESMQIIGKPGVDYEFSRGSYSYEVPEKSVVEIGDMTYILLEDAANNLGLSMKLDVSDRLLVVEQCMDLNQLYDIMSKMYRDDAISLSYWQNSFIYSGGYVAAVATDVISNMKFVSFLTTKDTQKSLKEAVWKTILPSSEDELYNFMVESNKMVKTIAKYKKYADNWTQVLVGDKNSGFMGEWGEFFGGMAKALDYLQFSETLNAINYSHGLKNADESYMNGLKILLDSQTKPENKQSLTGSLSTHVSPELISDTYQSILYRSVDEVYTAYKSQEPMWKTIGKEVISGVIDDVLDEVNDAVLKLFFAKEVVSISKTTMGLVMSTQDYVDGTILAHDCLELQKWCKQYKSKHWGDFNLQYGGITQKELDALKKMRDVGTIFLRTGVVANLAVPTEENEKPFVQNVIAKINGYLSEILAYQESDFTFVKDNKAVIDLLRPYADKIPVDETTLEVSFEESLLKGGVLSVSFHQMSDGTPLYVSLSGTYAGEGVWYSFSTGTREEYRNPQGQLLLTVNATSGYYRITIEPGVSIDSVELMADTPDSMIANAGMSEMTPVLTFEKPDGTITTSASYENYYVRYPTGVWGMSVGIGADGSFYPIN